MRVLSSKFIFVNRAQSVAGRYCFIYAYGYCGSFKCFNFWAVSSVVIFGGDLVSGFECHNGSFNLSQA